MFNAHVGKSVYVMQLQRWFNVFGRESFKVGVGSDRGSAVDGGAVDGGGDASRCRLCLLKMVLVWEVFYDRGPP